MADKRLVFIILDTKYHREDMDIIIKVYDSLTKVQQFLVENRAVGRYLVVTKDLE